MFLVWYLDIESEVLLGIWFKRSSIPRSIRDCPDVTIEQCKPDRIRSKDYTRDLARRKDLISDKSVGTMRSTHA